MANCLPGGRGTLRNPGKPMTFFFFFFFFPFFRISREPNLFSRQFARRAEVSRRFGFRLNNIAGTLIDATPTITSKRTVIFRHFSENLLHPWRRCRGSTHRPELDRETRHKRLGRKVLFALSGDLSGGGLSLFPLPSVDQPGTFFFFFFFFLFFFFPGFPLFDLRQMPTTATSDLGLRSKPSHWKKSIFVGCSCSATRQDQLCEAREAGRPAMASDAFADVHGCGPPS